MKIIAFDDTEIEKRKFHCRKNPVLIYNVKTGKLIVPKKVSFGKKGFKCFIGYKDNEKVKSLCIMFPKMSGYKKKFNETKYMSFLIKDDKLLENYDKIWDKISNAF